MLAWFVLRFMSHRHVLHTLEFHPIDCSFARTNHGKPNLVADRGNTIFRFDNCLWLNCLDVLPFKRKTWRAQNESRSSTKTSRIQCCLSNGILGKKNDLRRCGTCKQKLLLCMLNVQIKKPFGQRNPWRFGAPRRNSTPWQTKNINPELRTLKASISWLVREFVSALFQKTSSLCRLQPCAKQLIQNSIFCLTSPALFFIPPFQADDFLCAQMAKFQRTWHYLHPGKLTAGTWKKIPQFVWKGENHLKHPPNQTHYLLGVLSQSWRWPMKVSPLKDANACVVASRVVWV